MLSPKAVRTMQGITGGQWIAESEWRASGLLAAVVSMEAIFEQVMAQTAASAQGSDLGFVNYSEAPLRLFMHVHP